MSVKRDRFQGRGNDADASTYATVAAKLTKDCTPLSVVTGAAICSCSGEVLTETECGATPHLSAAGKSNLWSAGHEKPRAQIQSDVSLIKDPAGVEVDSTLLW